MKTRPRNFASLKRSGRRRGVSLVYITLSLPVLLGITGMVVDMGFLYFRRAEAQKAADAAALAGAMRLPDAVNALAAAKWMAGLNGYNANLANVTVAGLVAPDGNYNHYQVRVSKPEPLFFMGIFKQFSKPVGALAWAEYLSQAPININGGGTYGATGPISLAVFGPSGFYPHGDAYSTTNLSNGAANPLYNGKGYDFSIEVPDTMGLTWIEIFDPDCYNAGNVATPSAGVRVDELWKSNGDTGTSSNATTTKYSLYWDADTPNDETDDVLIQSTSYGNTSTTDMKWNNFKEFNRQSYPGGAFRMNVLSTSGSSENGFNLRAGPKRATQGTTFQPVTGNGTNITATGRLPMNFNTSGTVNIVLGSVPTAAAGGKMYIDKFDTDVGAKSVVYKCSSLPGQTFTGTLSANGTWKRDEITLPANYTEGTWTATYAANIQDTSVWTMSFSNVVPGIPGRVKLIK